jgi:ubiquinone/menaquinone biosynthesis C-methylase UbiE
VITKQECLLYKRFVDRYQPFLYPLLGARFARTYGRTGGTIIDMGTGPGYLTAELAQRTGARVHAVDINPAMHELARAHVEERGVAAAVSFDLVDVHRQPYADGYADLVVSYSCFHHWAEPARALRECARVLAPGGKLLLVDTQPVHGDVLAALASAIPEPELFRFVDEAFQESYSVEQVREIAAQAGLADASITSFDFDEEDLLECLDVLDGAPEGPRLPEGAAVSWLFQHEVRDRA